MPLCGSNNVRRAVQTDPTLLRYASSITGQKECWKLLALKFDWSQTARNNSQQHLTTCNGVCKRTQHLTSNNVASVCVGLTRPSRSMHFGDVSQTNGPRDPKRMGRAENEAWALGKGSTILV